MISTCVTMQVDRYRRQPETYNYAKMTATILIFRKRRPSAAHHGADPLFRRRILETKAAAALPTSTPHTTPPRSKATAPNSSPAVVVLSDTPAVGASRPDRADGTARVTHPSRP